MYNEAANSYKKSDPNEALNCLLKTVDIYIDMVTAFLESIVELNCSFK